MVKSGLDPHMVSWWFGWITVAQLWFGSWFWFYDVSTLGSGHVGACALIGLGSLKYT
jgi:hypothetical protein